MDNIFHSAKTTLTEELQRFRNRHFLEATMAGTALLALADHDVRLTESLALDYILENIRELKVYDVHKAVDIFRDYVEAMKKNAESGKEKVFKAAARFSKDEHSASLIVRACILIAKADGDFSEKEKDIIAELCRVLNLDASKIGM